MTKKVVKKMNEEENQAFKILYFHSLEDYGAEELRKYIKIIVNLVEKQQEEIKDLKTITQEYEAYKCGNDDQIMIASKQWFDKGYFKEHYISKDKIKVKIKELEKIKEQITTNEGMLELSASIDILKELLGE